MALKLFSAIGKKPPVRVALLAEARTGLARPSADILHRYHGADELAKKGEPFAKPATSDLLLDGFPIELTLIDGLEGGDETKKLWASQDAFVVLWHGPEPVTYGTAVRNATLAREKGRKEVPIVLAQIDAHLRDAKVKPPDVAGLLRDKKLGLTAVDVTVDTHDALAALIHEGARQALAAKNSDFRTLLKTMASSKVTLELRKRGLHALPASFVTLASTLEKIDISNNELGCVPTEVLQCAVLKELKANAVGATSLPTELPHKLLKLQLLHLEGNALEAVPHELADMKELKEVRLKGNPLPGYPKDVMASTALLLQHLRVLKGASSSAPARKGAGVHITFHVLCVRHHRPQVEAVCRTTVMREGEQMGQELNTGVSLAGNAPLWDQAFTLTGIPLDARLRFEVFGVREGSLTGALGELLGGAEVLLTELVKESDAQRAIPLVRLNGSPDPSANSANNAVLDVRFVMAGEGVTRPAPASAPALPSVTSTSNVSGKEGRDSKRRDKDEPNGVFGVHIDLVMDRDRKQWGASQRVPRLVEQAVDYLLLHGLALEGLFRIAGVQDEMRALRLAWNTGAVSDFKSEPSPHNVAGLLKAFLRELPVPLLTFELGPEFLRASDIRDDAQQVAALRSTLDKLPPVNRAVVELLVPFLSQVTDNAQVNRMGFANVAKVLGPNLYWAKEASAFDLTAIDKTNDLTTLLIQYSTQLFDLATSPDGGHALKHRLAGHRAAVTSLAVSEGEGVVACVWSADATGAIRRWDPEQCRPESGGAQVDGNSKVHALMFVPPARLVVAHSKGLQVRTTANGMPVEKDWPDVGECHSLTRTETHICAGANARLVLVALTNLERVTSECKLPTAPNTEMYAKPQVSAMAYARTARHVWVAVEAHVLVTSVTYEGSKVLSSWCLNGHVTAIAVAPNDESVYVACDDRLVLVYATGPSVPLPPPLLRVLDSHTSRVCALVALGPQLWVACSNGTLTAWQSDTYASTAKWATRATETLAGNAVGVHYNALHEEWHVWLAGADRFLNVSIAPTDVTRPPPLPVLAATFATTTVVPTALPTTMLWNNANATANGSSTGSPRVTGPLTPGGSPSQMVRQRRRPQLIAVVEEDEAPMPVPQRATVARTSHPGFALTSHQAVIATSVLTSTSASAALGEPPRLRNRTPSRATLIDEDTPLRAHVLRTQAQAQAQAVSVGAALGTPQGLHVATAAEEAEHVRMQHERVRAALAERQVEGDSPAVVAQREQDANKLKVDITLAKLAKFGLAPTSPDDPPLIARMHLHHSDVESDVRPPVPDASASNCDIPPTSQPGDPPSPSADAVPERTETSNGVVVTGEGEEKQDGGDELVSGGDFGAVMEESSASVSNGTGTTSVPLIVTSDVDTSASTSASVSADAPAPITPPSEDATTDTGGEVIQQKEDEPAKAPETEQSV